MIKSGIVVAAALALGACQGERSAGDHASEVEPNEGTPSVVGLPDDGAADGEAATDKAQSDQTAPVDAAEESSSTVDQQAADASAPAPEPLQTVAAAASSGNSAAGAQVFAQNCVACHGADGTGALPGTPDFTAASGPLAKSDEELLRHMSEGFQTPGSPMPMPAHGGNHELNDQDMANALAYLRSEFGR